MADSTSSLPASGLLPADPSRRNAVVATAAVGAVGAAAVAVPFVSTFQPSERAKAAGAPVEADISGMLPGELRRVEWRGNLVLDRRPPPCNYAYPTTTANDASPPQSDKTPPIPPHTHSSNGHTKPRPQPHAGCGGPQPGVSAREETLVSPAGHSAPPRCTGARLASTLCGPSRARPGREEPCSIRLAAWHSKQHRE